MKHLSDTPGRASINFTGLVSIVFGASSLTCWTVVFVCYALLTETPWEWEWDTQDQFRSWLRLFELIWLYLKSGLLGLVGVVISGLLSIMALISGCVGLAFQPRRPAVIGCILGATGAIPGLVLMVGLLCMILEIAGSK